MNPNGFLPTTPGPKEEVKEPIKTETPYFGTLQLPIEAPKPPQKEEEINIIDDDDDVFNEGTNAGGMQIK